MKITANQTLDFFISYSIQDLVKIIPFLTLTASKTGLSILRIVFFKTTITTHVGTVPLIKHMNLM